MTRCLEKNELVGKVECTAKEKEELAATVVKFSKVINDLQA